MKTCLLFYLIFLGTTKAFAFVILIDPGHGGKELGAVSTVIKKDKKGRKTAHKVYEKDLTLRLAKYVQKNLMGQFSVYLTRSFDRTVSLDDRASMADTVKADLFISIHFNSATEPDFHGFETYYLDNHNEKAIKKVESIENKDLTGEDKIINQILIDLVVGKTVKSSKKLAELIHGKVGRNIKGFKRKDRGIKPGLFYVLALSKRPGVLIEGGFMSNPKEIFQLKSDNYLKAYAKGISQGIIDFYKSSPKRDIPLF
tara:strand:+ start:209 stop:976 length:768 start_codon:yes stop_codon:yes gene_type:complete